MVQKNNGNWITGIYNRPALKSFPFGLGYWWLLIYGSIYICLWHQRLWSSKTTVIWKALAPVRGFEKIIPQGLGYYMLFIRGNVYICLWSLFSKHQKTTNIISEFRTLNIFKYLTLDINIQLSSLQYQSRVSITW